MKNILILALVGVLTGCASLTQGNWKSKAKSERKQVVEFCGSVPLNGIDNYPHLFKMAFLYGTQQSWEPEANKCVDEVNKTYAQSNSYEEWSKNIKETIARYTRVWGLHKGLNFNVSIAVLHKDKLETNKDGIVAILTQSTIHIQEASKEADNKSVSEFIKYSEQVVADTIVKEAEFLKEIGVYQ